MAEMYGHKWESAHGPNDAGNTWAIGLSEYKPEHIGRGLRACLERTDPWPPTLPEFRALCRPAKRENEAMYHGALLEHKLSDEDRAKGRAAIAKMRARL